MKKIIWIFLGLSLAINTALLYLIQRDHTSKIQVLDQSDPLGEDVVYWAGFDSIEVLKPLEKASIPLEDSLIMKSGFYSFNGNTYDLTKEGLYRFVTPGVQNEQRIVFNMSVDTLLSSLCWIAEHGNSDSDLNHFQLIRQCKLRKISVTCGEISALAKEIMDRLGVKSRLVSGLTLKEWNKYDNGHTLLEVLNEEDKSWYLVDLDKNVLFGYAERLNFLEVNKKIRNKESLDLKLLANNDNLSTQQIGSYDLNFITELNSNSDYLNTWYQRSLQVPLFNRNGKYYYLQDSNNQRTSEYSKNYIGIQDEDQFLNMFY